ncbi:MAG: polysaccharide deacetylase family protein [Bacillota bacterium]|nr:polysaccharide deacetylase family protein [Bacillota bacterium]
MSSLLRTRVLALCVAALLLASCGTEETGSSVPPVTTPETTSLPPTTSSEAVLSTLLTELLPVLDPHPPVIDAPSPITALGEDLFAELDNTATDWWYDRVKSDQLGTGYRPAPNAITELLPRYNGIWQYPDPNEPVLFMTMNCGHEYNGQTARILDIVTEKGVPTAFFLNGQFIVNAPDTVRRMTAEGHIVANHGMHHRMAPEVLAAEGVQAMLEDMEELASFYHRETGLPISHYVRPPSGRFSERVLALYDAAGYRTVFWDIAHVDWLIDNQPDPAKALAQLVGELHNGAVIILHPVGSSNVVLLPSLIDQARAAGYRFASLDEFPETHIQP